ncbi:hypothetical protein [Profundibacter sp.]|uniref:hypothetical protein n=1 Tax=Profundibacter sp. TaxID=3101071 RepID=UPI003D0B10FB
MIRSNQAGQAKNRPPRREEGENGNLQRFPKQGTVPLLGDVCVTYVAPPSVVSNDSPAPA